MLPDRVSNPGPLTYESGALPIALRGPAERYGGSFQTGLILRPIQNRVRDIKFKASLHGSRH